MYHISTGRVGRSGFFNDVFRYCRRNNSSACIPGPTLNRFPAIRFARRAIIVSEAFRLGVGLSCKQKQTHVKMNR